MADGAQFSVTVTLPPEPPSRRVVLWGARRHDVQAGSFADAVQMFKSWPRDVVIPAVDVVFR